MTIIEAIILGIIQGLTEFLPISSSGHLVLFEKIFSISVDFIFFSVVLHFFTLMSVVIYFRKDIWQLIKHPFSPLALKLYLATLPTIIFVLIFETYITELFSGKILPFSFLFTAILLLFAQFSVSKSEKKLDYKSSILMGVMQSIAVLPGISRSGTTICTGVLCGYEKNQVAKFSFLMSIPIIFASMLYELFKYFNVGGGQIYVLQTIIASLFAFVVGIFSIKFMLWIVKKLKFYWFSIYLVIIAIISFFFL